MTDKKDEDKEELEPLPRLLRRQSVAPPPPSHKARFRIRMAPSLARHFPPIKE